MTKSDLVSKLATVFGLGLSPKAPGTVGTLAGIPVWYLFVQTGPLGYMALTMAFIVSAIVISHLYESEQTAHDKPEIVIDEVAGFLVAMAYLEPSLKSIFLAFVLFRIFDIWKPQPIRYLNDHTKGGFGVVIDDVAAGLVTNIILQLLTR